MGRKLDLTERETLRVAHRSMQMYEGAFAEQRRRLYELLLKLRRDDVQMTDVAVALGLSRVTAYRYLRRAESVEQHELDRMDEAHELFEAGAL